MTDDDSATVGSNYLIRNIEKTPNTSELEFWMTVTVGLEGLEEQPGARFVVAADDDFRGRQDHLPGADSLSQTIRSLRCARSVRH